MRVLLTPIGSAGDNLPFIGLGRELARRGHDVTVATTDRFADFAGRCGLGFVSTATDEEYEAAIADPVLFHPRRGLGAVMERVGEYNRRLLEIVTAWHAEGPLLVVAHSMDFASRAVADATGLPVVRVHLQPSVVRTDFDVPVMHGTADYRFLPRRLKQLLWLAVDRAILDPAIAPSVNGIRSRLGLAPVRRVFATQIHSPLMSLAMFPAWYAPPQPDWPASLKQCGFPLFDAPCVRGEPDDAGRFVDAGPAPIVFTPGSAMRAGQAFFEAAAGACVRLGRRGILLTGDPGQVPATLPDGVVRFDYVPLSAVLGRCAALVHHGGIGTTAAGLAAGVPQVIVPFSHDQPDNAARVVRLGVGQRIMPRALDAARLARSLDALLGSDAVRRHCAETAALTRVTDGIGRACGLIESLLPGAGGAAPGRFG